MIEEHKYELTYTFNDKKVSMTFNGDIPIYDLRDEIKYFLLASSWNPELIDELFGESDA